MVVFMSSDEGCPEKDIGQEQLAYDAYYFHMYFNEILEDRRRRYKWYNRMIYNIRSKIKRIIRDFKYKHDKNCKF